jgi:hypothetical protein
MSILTLQIERELPSLEPEAARHFETAVLAMLRMAKRKTPGDGTSIAKQEENRYTLPTRDLQVRPGLDLTKLAYFDEDGLDILERP